MLLSIRAEKSWDPQQYPEKSPCERLPGRQRQIPSAEPGLWCEPTTPCCHGFYYVIEDRFARRDYLESRPVRVHEVVLGAVRASLILGSESTL